LADWDAVDADIAESQLRYLRADVAAADEAIALSPGGWS
jgi:hypothetical protein